MTTFTTEDRETLEKKSLELTDEEINTEMLAYLNSKTMGLEDFARAILRKVQEK